jgi:molybdopterin converting factor small subunit
MPVVELPSSLRALAGQKARLSLPGATVGQVLEAACLTFPPMRSALFTPQGQLKRTVTLFAGDEDVRQLGGLDAPIAADAVLVLITAIAGG